MLRNPNDAHLPSSAQKNSFKCHLEKTSPRDLAEFLVFFVYWDQLFEAAKIELQKSLEEKQEAVGCQAFKKTTDAKAVALASPKKAQLSKLLTHSLGDQNPDPSLLGVETGDFASFGRFLRPSQVFPTSGDAFLSLQEMRKSRDLLSQGLNANLRQPNCPISTVQSFFAIQKKTRCRRPWKTELFDSWTCHEKWRNHLSPWSWHVF